MNYVTIGHCSASRTMHTFKPYVSGEARSIALRQLLCLSLKSSRYVILGRIPAR